MAVLDFQYYLRTIYPKVEDLNKAWNTIHFNFSSINPVPPSRARSRANSRRSVSRRGLSVRLKELRKAAFTELMSASR